MTVPLSKIAGVCGWPIHHSLSPALHQFWLSKMNIVGGYVHFAVHPDEAVKAFKSLKETSISGVNVTSPLKKHAFMAADIHTKSAKALGVANCLYKKDGALIAHNTDVEGFLTPLLKHTSPEFIKKTPTIIFGAGGASRAVIGGLLNSGAPEIRICTRRDEQSVQMVSSVDVPNLRHVQWSKRQNSLKTAGLIINATTAGMHGRSALDIDVSTTPEGAVIYDLVYTPIVTPLIEQAQEHKRAYIGGLDMLIEQARPSFERFFGTRPADDLDPTALLLKHLRAAAHK